MRRTYTPRALPAPDIGQRRDWQTIRSLIPYIWAYRGRVLFALACLIAAKLANVGVPLVFKGIVDAFTAEQAALVVPLALLAAYGLLRFSMSLFTELRELLFARVTQQAVRNIALQVFRHLHALSPALPPRAADRRPDARHRARHPLHRHADQLHHLQHPADPGGSGAGDRHPGLALRVELRLDHRRRPRPLHHLHRAGDQLAHPAAARGQRDRLGRQFARHRQPAQLRDGEVLQQRGLRGAALRPADGKMGGRAGEEPVVAVPPQPRPGRPHRRHGDADHVAGGRPASPTAR